MGRSFWAHVPTPELFPSHSFPMLPSPRTCWHTQPLGCPSSLCCSPVCCGIDGAVHPSGTAHVQSISEMQFTALVLIARGS